MVLVTSKSFVYRRARPNKSLQVFLQCERETTCGTSGFCSQGLGTEWKNQLSLLWLRVRQDIVQGERSPEVKSLRSQGTNQRGESFFIYHHSPWFLCSVNQHVFFFSRQERTWLSLSSLSPFIAPLCDKYSNTSSFFFFLDSLRSAIPSATRVSLWNLNSFLHMALPNTLNLTPRSLMAYGSFLFTAAIQFLKQVSPSESLPGRIPLLSSLLFSCPVFFFINFSSFPTSVLFVVLILICFVIFLKYVNTQRLPSNSLCSPGCPQTHDDYPDSTPKWWDDKKEPLCLAFWNLFLCLFNPTYLKIPLFRNVIPNYPVLNQVFI